MTSSLVGSEMCIRDSGHADARCGRPGDESRAIMCMFKAVPRAQSHRIPVSYTHLTLPTICSV
eukprot:1746413-Prorocentrum_lima.AAC.1